MMQRDDFPRDELPARTTMRRRHQGAARALVGWLLCVGGIAAAQASAGAGAAQALRELHAAASERLRESEFGAPITITSTGESGRLEGEILARVDHPQERIEAALGDARHWCPILELQPNIRGCRVLDTADGTALSVRVGRRYDQPVRDTDSVRFEFGVRRAPGEYLAVRLHADSGPLGTRDYSLALESVPLAGGGAFLRMRYGQSHGLLARLAAHAYFAGAGSDKVGFSRDEDGRHVEGLRGAVERNAMRHYLAIDAWLSAFAQPAGQRFDAALQRWLDATERHARQLAEDDRGAYAAAKRAQRRR